MALGRWRKMEHLVLLLKKSAVSSAKGASWTPDVGRGMSLVYAEYRRGERAEPCGTPALINCLVDVWRASLGETASDRLGFEGGLDRVCGTCATSASSEGIEPLGLLSGGIGVYPLCLKRFERELSLRGCSRSGSILWSGICDRAAKLRFCSYQFEECRAKLPTIRGCRNLPLAFLDHRPDVAGKSTYSVVNLFSRSNVIRDAIERWSVDFSNAVDTLFQLKACLNRCMGSRVAVEGAIISNSSLWSRSVFSILIHYGTAPSGILQLKSPNRMCPLEGKEGSKITPEQRLWRREVDRDYDDSDGTLLEREAFPLCCGTLGVVPRTLRSPSSKPHGERPSPFGYRLQTMRGLQSWWRGVAPGERVEQTPWAAPGRPSRAAVDAGAFFLRIACEWAVSGPVRDQTFNTGGLALGPREPAKVVCRRGGRACALKAQGSLVAEIGFNLLDREIGWNAADDYFDCTLFFEGVCVKLDFEVYEIFVETAESLNVGVCDFNAVVGGADGFCIVYPQTCTVCVYLDEIYAFAQEYGWGHFTSGGAVDLLPVWWGALSVVTCEEVMTGPWADEGVGSGVWVGADSDWAPDRDLVDLSVSEVAELAESDSDSLSEPTTVLSEHVSSSSDDEERAFLWIDALNRSADGWRPPAHVINDRLLFAGDGERGPAGRVPGARRADHRQIRRMDEVSRRLGGRHLVSTRSTLQGRWSQVRPGLPFPEGERPAPGSRCKSRR
ncbi:hypothetical protein EVAR_29083_1 [Eumeta japonica]|uniref:Uncharacterized protein n=1 Tax=Eumeta variegata TaxID=151549 RepID=A0A4C1VMD8_EUMVA|nr:hypothetical protein EVAR_29083_1 [Eumeta japonica]